MLDDDQRSVAEGDLAQRQPTGHDLRRTAGTGMARLGIPKITISRVLNHAEGGVTEIYTRYSYLEEKREALNRWATKLQQLRDSF